MRAWVNSEEYEEIDTIFLGEVAVRGLKNFTTDGELTNHTMFTSASRYMPLDLEDCILRNNKGLEMYTVQKIARVKAKDAVGKCRKALKKKVEDSIFILSDVYTHQIANDEAKKEPREAMLEYVQILQNGPKVGTFETWVAGRERAKLIASDGTDRLYQMVRECVSKIETEFTRKLAAGEEANIEDFVDVCLQTLTKGPDLKEAEKWGPAQRQARNLVTRYSNKVMNTFREVSTDVENEYAKKIFNGEAASLEDIRITWGRRVVSVIQNGDYGEAADFEDGSEASDPEYFENLSNLDDLSDLDSDELSATNLEHKFEGLDFDDLDDELLGTDVEDEFEAEDSEDSDIKIIRRRRGARVIQDEDYGESE
ncbi:hypothetical protein ABW20_dc0107542 [Dactylellina cionopaga]|nr:hypothetical protein ABW20_dc0107542 [Dactylellina cionopaga]